MLLCPCCLRLSDRNFNQIFQDSNVSELGHMSQFLAVPGHWFSLLPLACDHPLLKQWLLLVGNTALHITSLLLCYVPQMSWTISIAMCLNPFGCKFHHLNSYADACMRKMHWCPGVHNLVGVAVKYPLRNSYCNLVGAVKYPLRDSHCSTWGFCCFWETDLDT